MADICAACNGDRNLIVKCSLCECQYHTHCVGITKENKENYLKVKKEVIIQCPVGFGCNQLDNKSYKCGRCQDIKSEISCSDCQMFHCAECSNMSTDIIRTFVMLTRRNKGFSWSCVNCLPQQNNEADSPRTAAAAEPGDDRKTAVRAPHSTNDHKGDDTTAAQYSEVCDNENKMNGVDYKQEKTCKFYLRKQCKHGKRGEKCSFRHPKLCMKFMNHGWDACNSSFNCKNFHPRMCNDSFNYMNCSNYNCKMLHIKNTWIKGRAENDQKKPQMGRMSTEYQTAGNRNKNMHMKNNAGVRNSLMPTVTKNQFDCLQRFGEEMHESKNITHPRSEVIQNNFLEEIKRSLTTIVKEAIQGNMTQLRMGTQIQNSEFPLLTARKNCVCNH